MKRPRIPDDRRAGCCLWGDFWPSFEEYMRKWFDAPISDAAWKSAVRDWRAGNTGYEAAHNYRRRTGVERPAPPLSAGARTILAAANDDAEARG